jgi:hypothetical protein
MLARIGNVLFWAATGFGVILLAGGLMVLLNIRAPDYITVPVFGILVLIVCLISRAFRDTSAGR